MYKRQIIDPGALRQTIFVWGESAHIWGSYGGLKSAILAYFGLFLLGNLNSDFGFFNANRQPLGPNRDSGNLKEIAIPRFEKKCAQSWKKRIFDLEYFRVVRGLNNGVMVTAAGGRSVTVRDRPHNVLGVE